MRYADQLDDEARMQPLRNVRDVFEHTPGFIAFTEGPDHYFTYANPSYKDLVGRGDLVGRKVADALPEAAEQGFVALLDDVFRTGRHFIGRRAPISLNRGADGERQIRYIDFVYQAVKDSSGQIVGLFCEGSDVTDVHEATQKLVIAEDKLIHLSRLSAMGTMAATLAHELNQPLSAITNYAEGCSHIVDSGSTESDQIRAGLEEISSSALRAGQIISKLRDMTRRAKPELVEVDLTDALREAVELVQASECAKVRLVVDGPPVARVLGDRGQIQQVVINLLRNACEAAQDGPEKGEVSAKIAAAEMHWDIEITDNGSGLSDHALGDLFEWTESSKPNGMGMGLSISRTIAEALGGKIKLNSTGPGGSKFSFLLPKA